MTSASSVFDCFRVKRTSASCVSVELPPQKLETETSKVLTFDHFGITTHGHSSNPDKAKLNIEEFACGVQLEGSETTKQEWSFTLYDFEGHGRITKEDLSSVLKALYDAVGSSIKLPPNGARTLKLRLSVGGQDSSGGPLNLTATSRNTNNKVNKCKVKDFSKLNNLTRTQLKCINENQPVSTDTTTLTSAVPANEIATRLLFGQSELGKSHLKTNQLSSLTDHRQLADLVQENMERNRIKQLRRHSRNTSDGQHKRRHRSSGTGAPSGPSQCPVTSAVTAATASGKAVEENNVEEKAKESQDRRNYYLDLAGVENTTSKFQNNPTVPLAGSGCVRTGSGHHRSRSHDIATKCDNHLRASGGMGAVRWDKCDNVRRESERLAASKQGNNAVVISSCTTTAAAGGVGTATTAAITKGDQPQQSSHPRSKSFDSQEVVVTSSSKPSPKSPKSQAKQKNNPASSSNPTAAGGATKTGRFRPVSLPGHVPVLVSPHYHRRHRHRDKDHSLAMQQVAQWIEREHAWDVDGDRLVVQKHEHHHIHEHHHHHHYHHYYEA